jgi:hypothetical protein
MGLISKQFHQSDSDVSSPNISHHCHEDAITQPDDQDCRSVQGADHEDSDEHDDDDDVSHSFDDLVVDQPSRGSVVQTLGKQSTHDSSTVPSLVSFHTSIHHHSSHTSCGYGSMHASSSSLLSGPSYIQEEEDDDDDNDNDDDESVITIMDRCEKQYRIGLSTIISKNSSPLMNVSSHSPPTQRRRLDDDGIVSCGLLSDGAIDCPIIRIDKGFEPFDVNSDGNVIHDAVPTDTTCNGIFQPRARLSNCSSHLRARWSTNYCASKVDEAPTCYVRKSSSM